MPVRVIHVGLGPWGRSWAGSVLSGSPGVEVVGWVDPDPAARRLARELTGAPEHRFHAGLDEALATHPADAVLATTGIAAHTPVALAALRAGKHVLLEKPFAPTPAEAAQVVAEAASRGLVLAICQNYRFFRSTRALTDLVRAGTLGPVDRVRVDFRRYHPGQGAARLNHELLMPISIHHFDLMRAVLGREPVRISCHEWSPQWARVPGRVAVAAIVDFEGGAVVSYSGSRLSTGPQTPWEGEWHVECERGEIRWLGDPDRAGGPDADSVLVRPRGAPAYRVPLPKLPHEERAGVLHDFLDAVRDGAPLTSPGHDNIRSVALMAAARESATSGRAVPISVPERATTGEGGR